MGRTSDAEQRILKAAVELFRRRGFGAVGISEVCAAAGVNKGSFYHFYKSKQALAIAVLDAYSTFARGSICSAIESAEDPIDQIRAIFSSNAAIHVEVQASEGCVSGCMFGNLALELSTQDEVVRAHVEKKLKQQADVIAGVLQNAVDQGKIAALDTAATADQLIALLQGGVLLAKVQNSSAPLDALSNSALRLIGAAPQDAVAAPA